MAAFNLISEHSLLSASETKKVLNKFGVQVEKLPKIQENDPQAIALNAKAGSVIEISREDPTGKYSCYRYVIK
ncbi:MAG: DNA-directed RNA polymerase subunit H [Candidatus Micrarchaeota archaeon]|nr:DNA-directed RNA polymerase subunit H [Candidatus Micrarchaeota archaeon]